MNGIITTDKNDPRLAHGLTEGQAEVYLVLSIEERAKGFVRSLRMSYVHTTCSTETTMTEAIAETYARDPKFYGYTYCVKCMCHRPVDEFVWTGTNEIVGS